MTKAEQILKKHLAGGHMAFAIRQMVLAAMEEYAQILLNTYEKSKSERRCECEELGYPVCNTCGKGCL